MSATTGHLADELAVIVGGEFPLSKALELCRWIERVQGIAFEAGRQHATKHGATPDEKTALDKARKQLMDLALLVESFTKGIDVHELEALKNAATEITIPF